MSFTVGKFPSWPPRGAWDSRMVGPLFCPDLQPVEVVHENPWFTVRNRGGYFTAEPRWPQLVVLPIVDRDHVIMVRVIRPVIEDATLELPAGGFDPDRETAVQGAARELAEETGVLVDDLDRFQPLPPLSVSPNRIPRLAYLFQVELTRAEFEQRRSHDQEIHSVHCFPLSDVADMILNGEVYVTMPVALIGRYWMARGVRRGERA
ncbi:MAG: NUDIX hydrolase [Magnetococcus sp. YQC-3]